MRKRGNGEGRSVPTLADALFMQTIKVGTISYDECAPLQWQDEKVFIYDFPFSLSPKENREDVAIWPWRHQKSHLRDSYGMFDGYFLKLSQSERPKQAREMVTDRKLWKAWPLKALGYPRGDPGARKGDQWENRWPLSLEFNYKWRARVSVPPLMNTECCYRMSPSGEAE